MTKELDFLIKAVKSASELITEEFEVRAKDDNGDLVTILIMKLNNSLQMK